MDWRSIAKSLRNNGVKPITEAVLIVSPISIRYQVALALFFGKIQYLEGGEGHK